jgi:hypothetical protein
MSDPEKTDQVSICFFVTVVSIARMGGGGKCGLPTVLSQKVFNVSTGLLSRFARVVHSPSDHFFEGSNLLVG